MKKIFLILIFGLHSLFWTQQATAAACATSSLGSYVSLGSGGCTIGAFTFSGFNLLSGPNSLSRPAGSIPFTSISVTPVMLGTTIVGFDFGVSPGVTNLNFYDDLIGYRISGANAMVTAASIFLNGVLTSGTGAVTAIDNLCLGGTFLGSDGVSNCSQGAGAERTLLVANDSVPDSIAFAGIGTLAVVTDIGLDSGPGGSGSLQSVSDRFTVTAIRVVPEPVSALLIGAGALAFLATKRRRSNQKSSRV